MNLSFYQIKTFVKNEEMAYKIIAESRERKIKFCGKNRQAVNAANIKVFRFTFQQTHTFRGGARVIGVIETRRVWPPAPAKTFRALLYIRCRVVMSKCYGERERKSGTGLLSPVPIRINATVLLVGLEVIALGVHLRRDLSRACVGGSSPQSVLAISLAGQ